ncbi:alpha/beta hydrolase [Leptothoe sp. PORK10 BA2]|uniref:alpha/beta hydrolase n=1 Tax=Leptothoe sp. PORK10 BA2 TaxID=3110254 RepID=UPI002B1FFE7A|nr:alpha/beta hydrolase [Leptothoe sp. PORK10 BA2]MEA5466290.1 alpha/beta hydrolase [Leptothoe sp. PORK10 BA2]
MYVVTNRILQPSAPPEERFGTTFNPMGPNELRLAEAKKIGNRWQVDILSDRVTYNGEQMWASEAAFLKAQKRMCQNHTDALFFVHGFNTDFNNALESAYRIEQLYNLEVILFTWPSNGGGTIDGLSSYQDDKRDAVLSIGALDRCFEKLAAYFIKYADQACKRRFNLALHSMGNYLFKRLLESSIYQGETLLFDNIVMLAADVNNEGHADWVDRVRFRNRLFITINEDDAALAASKALAGDEQKARLGHWSRNLSARNATYLDFTDSANIQAHHNYFSDDSALQNERIKEVFKLAFSGEKAERGLAFDAGTGAYRIL